MVEATDKDTEAQVQRCRHHRVLDSKQALPTDRLPPSADRQTDRQREDRIPALEVPELTISCETSSAFEVYQTYTSNMFGTSKVHVTKLLMYI